ncbi:MAG: hypothetical protein ABIJ96_17290 [Elusimicrobiota bacterium]
MRSKYFSLLFVVFLACLLLTPAISAAATVEEIKGSSSEELQETQALLQKMLSERANNPESTKVAIPSQGRQKAEAEVGRFGPLMHRHPKTEKLTEASIADDEFETRPGYVVRYGVSCPNTSKPTNFCLGVDILSVQGHLNHGPAPSIEYLSPQCHLRVPGNNPVYWEFVAPSFASQIRLVVVASGGCGNTLMWNGDVKIPGLKKLVPGEGYELIGATQAHPETHYLMPEVETNLRGIASSYAASFPDAKPLQIHDISLPLGGVLDVYYSFKHPHTTHWWGYEADIPRDEIPEDHRARLEQIMEEAGARVLVEQVPYTQSTHYHLDFTPPGHESYLETPWCYCFLGACK